MLASAEATCTAAAVKFSSQEGCDQSGCDKTCTEGTWGIGVRDETMALGSTLESGDCKGQCDAFTGKYTSGDSVELTGVQSQTKMTISKDGSNMLKADFGAGCVAKYEVTQGCILDAKASASDNGASLRTLPSAIAAMAAGAVTALVGGMRRRV